MKKNTMTRTTKMPTTMELTMTTEAQTAVMVKGTRTWMFAFGAETTASFSFVSVARAPSTSPALAYLPFQASRHGFAESATSRSLRSLTTRRLRTAQAEACLGAGPFHLHQCLEFLRWTQQTKLHRHSPRKPALPLRAPRWQRRQCRSTRHIRPTWPCPLQRLSPCRPRAPLLCTRATPADARRYFTPP